MWGTNLLICRFLNIFICWLLRTLVHLKLKQWPSCIAVSYNCCGVWHWFMLYLCPYANKCWIKWINKLVALVRRLKVFFCISHNSECNILGSEKPSNLNISHWSVFHHILTFYRPTDWSKKKLSTMKIMLVAGKRVEMSLSITQYKSTAPQTAASTYRTLSALPISVYYLLRGRCHTGKQLADCQ